MSDETPNLPAVQPASEAAQVERAGFADLRAMIAEADAKVTDLVKANDDEALAWGVASVAILLRDLRQLEQSAKLGLHEVMERKGEWELRIELLGEFTRTFSGGSTKTDWDALRDMMRQRALFDPETGEVAGDEAAGAVDRLLDIVFEVAPLTPSTNARVGAMKSTLGLDKDQIADINEKQRKKPTVRFDPSATEKKERG